MSANDRPGWPQPREIIELVVGLGVIGFQRAQVQRRALERFLSSSAPQKMATEAFSPGRVPRRIVDELVASGLPRQVLEDLVASGIPLRGAEKLAEGLLGDNAEHLVTELRRAAPVAVELARRVLRPLSPD